MPVSRSHGEWWCLSGGSIKKSPSGARVGFFPSDFGMLHPKGLATPVMNSRISQRGYCGLRSTSAKVVWEIAVVLDGCISRCRRESRVSDKCHPFSHTYTRRLLIPVPCSSPWYWKPCSLSLGILAWDLACSEKVLF